MSDMKASVIMQLVDRVTRPARRIKSAFNKLRNSARFKQLAASIRQVGERFKQVGTHAKNLVKNVLKITAVAGAASYALFRLTSGVAGYGDNVAKTSKKLGLGVQELQAYRFAAEKAGVAQNTFDMGMQRFIRRAAEAVDGTGEAKDALKFLKIELQDSDGRMRKGTDMLLDVADGLANVKDQGLRVRLAMKLFDSEGVAMVNMLQNGSAALKKQIAFAREMGLITEEGARRSEEHNDALTDFRWTVRALRDSVVLELLPGLTSWLQSTGKLIRANREMITGKLLNNLREFWEGLKAIGGGISTVVEFLGGWKNALAVIATLISGKILLGIGMMAWQIGIATKALYLAKGAVWAFTTALLANPITLVAVGIAALVAGIILLKKNWVAVSDVIGGTIESWGIWIDGFVSAIRSKVGSVITWLKRKFSTITDSLPSFVKRMVGVTPGRNPTGAGVGPLSSMKNQPGRTEVGGTLKIEIGADGRPRVRELRSNGPMDIDVDAGPIGVGLG